MSDSFQSEVPKARINLKLDLHTGGATKKTELPLKLLVAGISATVRRMHRCLNGLK